jgi:hypothetical protein
LSFCFSSQHKFEDKNVNFAEKEIDYEEPALLLACGKFDGSNSSTWYLDTGASNHMCGMKEAFVDIDESYKGNITFGDLSQIPVKGRGRILIELKNGEQKFISEVSYSPDMKNNILSLWQFLEKGFEVQMKDKNLKIFYESGAAIASVKMTRNRMFPLDLSIYLSKCFKAEISNIMEDISDGCKVSIDNLEQVVYVEQPAGFVVKGEEEKVCRLKKALYRLKQAPRAWNSRIDGYLSQKGFTRCPYEHALYVKKSLQGRVMFVCLYVDDILFTEDDPTMIQDFKQSMVNEFEMTDLGLMAYFLGL